MTSITSEQSRAARALLGWSQDTLEAKAGVAKKTIALFEVGDRAPRDSTVEKLKAALEKAGVIFIDQNGEGPGVRLKKRAKA